MYGGPENCPAGLASGPAMVARASEVRSREWMCAVASGCAVSGWVGGVVMRESAQGGGAWLWTVGCSPDVAWRGSESSHAGICGTARNCLTCKRPEEGERS
jgi:hypothetical protein